MHVKKCSFKVSNLFIDCEVLTCNFHREQAWGRWLNATKNSAKRMIPSKHMVRKHYYNFRY